MKRVIFARDSNNLLEQEFDVDIYIDFSEIYDNSNDSIAAAEYKSYTLPDGELPPAGKHEKWSTQVIDDYNSFLESLEAYLTEEYDLQVYYKNKSKWHSLYLAMLAKDSDGNLIFKFRFKFRVSGHPAHRSKESQKHKAEEKHAIQQITSKRLQPIVKAVTVNEKLFANYIEAIVYIDDIVDEVMTTMRR